MKLVHINDIVSKSLAKTGKLTAGLTLAIVLGISLVTVPAHKASALTCGSYGRWTTSTAYKFQAGTWCMAVQYQQLVWQSDGNLVQYSTIGGIRSVHWATGTQNRGKWLAFQTDGNLVIYDASNHAIWANGARVTSGHNVFTLNALNGGQIFEDESGSAGTVRLWTHN